MAVVPTSQNPLVNALVQQAFSGSGPIIQPSQTLGRLTQAFVASQLMRQERDKTRRRGEAFADALKDAAIAGGMDADSVDALVRDPALAQAAAPAVLETLFERDPVRMETLTQAQAEAEGFQAGDVVQRNPQNNTLNLLRQAPAKKSAKVLGSRELRNLTDEQSVLLNLENGDRTDVLQFPDGSIMATAQGGEVKVPLGTNNIVDVGLQEQAGPGGTRTSAARQRQVQGEKDAARPAIAQSLVFLNNAMDLPKATSGPVIAGSEFLGSVAAYADLVGLGNTVRGLQEEFTQQFAGTSPEMVREIATQGRAELASNLVIITGDTTRYSDQDQARATRALPLAEPGSDAFETVVAATEFAVMRIMRDFQFSVANGVKPEVEVTPNAEVNAVRLRQKGMGIDPAIALGQKLADRWSFYTVTNPPPSRQ